MLPFRLYALLILLCIGIAPAQAEVRAGKVGTPIAICVRPDAPGLDPTDLLRTPRGLDCTTPQRNFGPGDFWVVSRPLHIDTDGSRLTVRVASVWQKRMTLYALYADGARVKIATDAFGATRNLQLGAIIQNALPRRPVTLTRLLWHVEGSANVRGIVLAPTVATGPQAATSNVVMAGIYAAFGGLCLALLLYNLGLARALRHAFLPFYCAMMAGMLIYAFSSSGALAWAMPEIANNERLRLNYVLLAMTGVAAILFLRHIFENGVIPLWLDRVLNLSCIVLAVPTLGIALLAPWQFRLLDMAYSFGFAVMVCTAIPMIVYAWIRRSAFLWLFIIAWSAPIGLAIIRIGHGLNLLPYDFWIDNSTILSMASEALLSSLAIAYRILLITRERDAARAQEIAAHMLADADPLTGLMNRRSFLREAIGRDGDQQLLLLDIDHFKRVNDTIGHDGGDEVLRLVALVLRDAIGATSVLARIGGEEFAIVTPLADALDPDHVLAELRGARMPFDLTVTASIGACIGPLAIEADWKSMYCAADLALFDAKRAGRDRARKGDPALHCSMAAA
ncbi:GGDEF domain-containing protein [Sphingomonas sp. PB4P5]|uniref:GGDEF domain-containing protein n=1 Tax=Parasphingomonas puruogangriensis TaxID=3096155 RepID=UPI002FC8E869